MSNKKIMTWNDNKDLLLLKEVAAEGVFYHKYLSRERGSAWQTVAENLNASAESFQDLSSRSVRDRYSTILKKYKTKIARESRESGGSGEEPSEAESLLDDLIALADDTEKQSNLKKEAVSKDKQKAEATRIAAMERLNKKKRSFVNDSDDDSDDEVVQVKTSGRRRPSDTIEWLREKAVTDAKTKEEELKHKKLEMELAKEQQKLQAEQNTNQMTLILKQMEKQQQQQQQQQQQVMMLQQQMFAFMQNVLQKKD